MALVVYDRVQETTATTGTGTITLAGAVAGYQSFAVVGNGNTTFYCIVNGTAWEVGIGTYSTTGPTLARTTVLSNSNGNTSPITLSGASNVFCTYPSEKSVNLDASGNVSALGTVSSGIWQGTTVGVAYGGTGATASSGANSVVLRDANQNIAVNSLTQNLTKTASAGGTTTLTLASSHFQILTGTLAQTYKLPDATSLPVGTTYTFDNDSTQNLTIQDNALGTVDIVAPGGYTTVFLEANGTVAGEWGRFGMLPNEVNWGTNSLSLASTVITGGTWQGGTIASGYGGTGLTTFVGANNALYSTSASALTAGTLPIAAGGTGQTTASAAFNGLSPITTAGDLILGTGVNTAGRLGIGANGTVLTSNGTTASWSTTYAGTVTSVAQSFTGGLISVSGSPVTTSGTLALTVAGTSGGIPYFSSASTWASSAALAANALMVGGGAGVAPSTITTGTGVVTALGVNTGTAGSFVVNGGALGTPSSGVATNLTGTAAGLSIGGNAATATTATTATTANALNTSNSYTVNGLTSNGQLTVNNTVYFNTGTGASDFADLNLGGVGGWTSGESHGINTYWGTIASPNIFSRFDSQFNGSVGTFRWKNLYYAGPQTSTVMTLTAASATTANLNVTGSITGSSFSGAGTGLTGTASGLNIGGNAATATSATTATTATNWGSYGAVPAAGTSFGTANTIGRSDANGYTYFGYINSSTANSENPAVSQVIVTNGSDNFYRKSSIASFTTYLSGTASGLTAGSATTATTATTANALNTGNAYTGAGFTSSGAFTATSNSPFFLNATTVSANYTSPANYNLVSAGPITINTGVTVTIDTTGTWVIV